LILVQIYLFILQQTCLRTQVAHVAFVDSLYFHFLNTYLFVNIFIYTFICFKLLKCEVIFFLILQISKTHLRNDHFKRPHLHYKILTRFSMSTLIFICSTIWFFLLSNSVRICLHTASTLVKILFTHCFLFSTVSTKLIYRKYSHLKLLHSRTAEY